MLNKTFHIGVFAAFVLFLQGCYEEPVANFDYEYTTDNVAPATVNFTNFSTEAEEYIWDFGDGNSSTEMSPVHVYELQGTYTITLTAKGRGGENMMSKSINIIRPTTYKIQNNTSPQYQLILYNLASYYWDPVNNVAFDEVEHGTLYIGHETEEVETDRPSIEVAFQFWDHPDSTWYYAFVDPVFQIIPNTLNILDIHDNTTIWWFEDERADPLERPGSGRGYSRQLKALVEE